MSVDLDIADSRMEGVLELLRRIHRCDAWGGKTIHPQGCKWQRIGEGGRGRLNLSWGRSCKRLHDNRTKTRPTKPHTIDSSEHASRPCRGSSLTCHSQAIHRAAVIRVHKWWCPPCATAAPFDSSAPVISLLMSTL